MDELLNDETIKGYRIKFVLIGDKKVGKTTIVNYYANNKVIQEYNETPETKLYKANAKINNKDFIIKIIDTPSNKQFLNIIKGEYQNANYILIVFDLTNRETFLSLNEWINHCRSVQNQNMDLILIGNKSDLNQNRVVSTEEAKKFASDNNIEYFEISAYNKDNIKNIFDNAISGLFKKINDDYNTLASTTIFGFEQGSRLSITINNENNRNNKKCCC